jgi:copper chaperone CopZ
MATAILSIPDISCEHCGRTILQVLGQQPGVDHVQVDIPAKQVTLTYNEALLDLQRVAAVLGEEGYPVASEQRG